MRQERLCLAFGRIRPEAPIWGESMISRKNDTLTCVLVVVATLLLGFARCRCNTTKAP